MVATLLLTSEDISGLASPKEYVDAVKKGYQQHGSGAPLVPRASLFCKDPPGKLTGYSTILPEDGVMGGYLYSAGFTSQDAWFVTTIFDAKTGAPLAILDGASFNPYKTGAVGALGIETLARKNASTLAVIGSGPQAKGQLRAAVTVRNFDSINVYSSTKRHRESFAKELTEELDIPIKPVSSSKLAISSADVIITATNSSIPVFDGRNVSTGAHITAIGQYHPRKRELDEHIVQKSLYVPDLRSRVFTDAGSFLAAFNMGLVDETHIHAELSEVINGVSPGRTTDSEITIFDSGGTAIETISSAYMLYQKALQSGLGTTLQIEPSSTAMN